jgi:hypothetical protein
MERRFVVRETYDVLASEAITESELINRIDHIRSLNFITSQQAIHLLLTGCIKEE